MKPPEKLSELPEAIISACLVFCRREGPASAREVMRHLYAELERPKCEASARLMAQMYERIEQMLLEAAP